MGTPNVVVMIPVPYPPSSRGRDIRRSSATYLAELWSSGWPVVSGLFQTESGAKKRGVVAAGALPASTVEARETFFGAANVNRTGEIRDDRVIVTWFGVASLAVSLDGRVVLLDIRRIGRCAGFSLAADLPERVRFSRSGGSFSVAAGAPSENVEMAFAVQTDPARLLDPDGNVVELVRRDPV